MAGPDFAKALEAAQQLPDLDDVEGGRIPDMFATATGVSRTSASNPNAVAGAATLPFTYNCERLVVGKVTMGYCNGNEEFEEQDDSDRLAAIMNMNLRGEAVISNKTETFLKDGTVVIWLEWLTPKKQFPSKRNWLTADELLSPESKKEPKDSGETD